MWPHFKNVEMRRVEVGINAMLWLDWPLKQIASSFVSGPAIPYLILRKLVM